MDLRHALAAGTTEIVIDNPWGDIYVRRNSEREVFVHAVVQQLGTPAARADVELKGGSKHANLRVRFDGAGADCQRQAADGGRYGRVDVSVFVPADVRLKIISACDGRINTDHIIGDLVATSEQGAISTSVSGRARIRSTSAVIRAFLQAESSRPSSLQTAGGIVLSMPLAVSAAVDARACSGFRSLGFAWLTNPLADGCEQANAVFGGGDSQIAISSGSFVDLRLRGTSRQ